MGGEFRFFMNTTLIQLNTFMGGRDLLFKRAFLLYQGRDKRLFYNFPSAPKQQRAAKARGRGTKIKKTLTNQIFYLKNSMITRPITNAPPRLS